jgi:hypothetical protein
VARLLEALMRRARLEEGWEGRLPLASCHSERCANQLRNDGKTKWEHGSNGD